MINLSLAAPSPSLPKTINSAMPTAAPPLDDGEGFSRSLDRVQTPRAPAPPPESKVKIDNGGGRPDAAGNDGKAAAESKRALDALGAMQRTAATRQAALRQVAQAAQAAETAKAGKAGTATDEGRVVAPEPIVPPIDHPAAGPDSGPDCEFHPDTTPTDNPGIVVPPTILPAEVPRPKHTLPALLPETGAGTKDGDRPGLPPRLPPLVEGEAGDPRLSGQPVSAQPIKGDPIAILPSAPVRFNPTASRQVALPAAREADKVSLAGSVEHRKAKGVLPLPIADSPSAPLMPANPGNLLSGPSSLPALLSGSNLRAATEAMSNAAAQSAAAALAAVLPSADNLRGEATASTQLQARPGSSEFAEQLGSQVAVWAKGGVQRASLQLNPLELGPVSVQIQLDGNSAQVSLAADLAATRLALEQALPSLASSLREAGLTLTGGGVFDQNRQQAGADGNGNGNRNNAAGDSRRTLPALEVERADRVATATPRSRGVVDLMA